MAKEKEVQEVISKIGYEPMEGRCIIVSYAAANLSDKIAKFFQNEFYVFQMCKKEVVLVPFGQWKLDLKKEVTLDIPYEIIKSIQIVESGLNYKVTIETDDDEIILSAQQKELSDWRSAGTLAGTWGVLVKFSDNWHKANLDDTLEELRNLKK